MVWYLLIENKEGAPSDTYLIIASRMLMLYCTQGVDAGQKRSAPGIEPGTTSTLRKYHTPRPSGHLASMEHIIYYSVYFWCPNLLRKMVCKQATLSYRAKTR